MIRWVLKYGAVIFLLNSIFLTIASTYSVANIVFLLLMALFAIFLFINPREFRRILFHKAFLFFLFLNIINFIYFLLFHNFTDIDAGKYLLARAMQFSIISVSIVFHYEYYKSKFLEHIVYMIFLIFIISLIKDPNIFSGRYSGIVWNPNSFAQFSIIAFAILFYVKEEKDNLVYVLLFTSLLFAIVSGSRGVLLAIPLIYFLKNGFSSRNILYAIIGVLIYVILANLQLETSINRFSSRSLFDDRILQYKYAFETLLNKPWFGYGLDKYSYLDIEVVPINIRAWLFGAHNGYLAILVQYGFLFGLIVLFIIFNKVIKMIIAFRNYNGVVLFYLFIVVYTIISAMYESYITGINEFQTILFWHSLAFLSYTHFKSYDS